MDYFVKPKEPTTLYKGKDMVAIPRQGIKKGQVNTRASPVPRSIPRRIPASPAVRVYTFGSKV